MIKDFNTYINEGLFDRNQSEFVIRKTDKGVEKAFVPRTKEELFDYIYNRICDEQKKKNGTYPNMDFNEIDISKLESSDLSLLFSASSINPDISSWDLKTIPYKFFHENISIKEFIIPDSVTTIESWAFSGCNHLTSIIIPNSVTKIAPSVFSDCRELRSVSIISNAITSIEPHTFEDCWSLTSIKIPEGVKNIEHHAFNCCKSLTSVIIPDSVESIGDWVFYACEKLKKVTIPRECVFETNSFPEKCNVIRK